MNMLVDGTWTKMDRTTRDGQFKRPDSSFRDRVSKDGAGGFAAEPGRYHLYVSYACPWACRTLLVRRLKGLNDVIGVTSTGPDMLENGWSFEEPEPLMGLRHVYEIYLRARPDYTGRVTVPVLWDKQRRTIVNNESADIIRMLEYEFDAWGDAGVDLYPEPLRAEIDAFNDRLYHAVNNGVYKAGFATSQPVYEETVQALFAMLDEIEERLGRSRFLFGADITEPDVRLFTTGVRFDLVYYSHFKCNVRQWRDYPNLQGWLKDMYQYPGVAETVDLHDIKWHYYHSQQWVNPSGIVPLGPTLDLTSPHGRQALSPT